MFFILNCRSWNFKPLLEKANPTSIDSLLDNPNPLIRNVSAQPLTYSLCLGGLQGACQGSPVGPTVNQGPLSNSPTAKMI